MTYQVIDTKTGDTVKTFADSRKAHRYADRKDLEYGAVRYSVRIVR